MEDGKKAIVGLGLATAIGGIYLATKAKAAPAPPPEGAGVEIEIRDSEGNIVPHNSPASLNEGEIYTVKVTVTNMTTRGGEPWEAELTTTIEAWVTDGFAKPYLIVKHDMVNTFAGDQATPYNYIIFPEIGTGGMNGGIFVTVYDPFGNVLKQVNEDLTIIALPIIYGAGIVIGV